MNDIIVAQSTPSGLGALAIVRFSGKDIRKLLDLVINLKSKKKIYLVDSHTIHYGTFFDENNNEIDHIMLAIMDGPRSFTGENSAEVTCHNNPFIISKIIQTAIFYGARLANRGEFTERACINNKIDIFQAEAINELLHAQSEITTKAALSQLNGSLSNDIKNLEKQLITISAWCHANFEFLEEEHDFTKDIILSIENTIDYIHAILKKYDINIVLKKGINIGIIGHVNVGKSSLLNSLVGYKRAIVSDIAGTTRDTIEVLMNIADLPITLTDTAGIRTSKNSIEQEGITKSIDVLEKSEIILLVYTESTIKNKKIYEWYKDIIKNNKKKVIIIKNKTDQKNTKTFFQDELLCSMYNPESINIVYKKIEEWIKYFINTETPEYLINNRHVENLKKVKNNIISIKEKLLQKNIFYEIIIEELYKTQEIISILQAKSIQNDVFNEVFKTFCVGK